MIRNLFPVVCGLMVASGAAIAASPTTPTFNEIDKDANGYLTRAELLGAHIFHARVVDFDSNGDGRISKVEFKTTTYTDRSEEIAGSGTTD